VATPQLAILALLAAPIPGTQGQAGQRQRVERVGLLKKVAQAKGKQIDIFRSGTSLQIRRQPAE
jgi:hypothetical protein